MRPHHVIVFLAVSLGATACSEAPQSEPGNRVAGSDVTLTTPVDTVDQANKMEGAAGNVTGASSATAPTDRDAWVGRWIGVEGLNLTVSKGATQGHYSLKMQYGTDAEMSGTFDGVGTAEGISFARPDGDQVLGASTGDETGLKYLAGKTDCLKVKVGEGYCRK
jgi:hypothetical protein